uniref:Uncharacterized protein n=1 Tax=Physcomitrium patens TaxID=3218 RepID=A0A2K1K9U6_PHYPA|nr:hypothetical protein PHYPA_009730 [Physcomitrium patens]
MAKASSGVRQWFLMTPFSVLVPQCCRGCNFISNE